MYIDESLNIDSLTGGETIKLYRKALGITQQQLGEAVGKSRATIAKVEAGKSRIDIDTMVRIAAHLNIPIALVFRDEIKSYSLMTFFEGETCIEAYNAICGAEYSAFYSYEKIDANKSYVMITEHGHFLCRETNRKNPKRAVCADMDGYLYVCIYSGGAYKKECDGSDIEISEVTAEVIGKIKDFGVLGGFSNNSSGE